MTGSEEVTEKLDPKQEREAERRENPSAIIVHEAIRIEGEKELNRPSSSIAWSGLAAGLSMGFSMVAEGVLHTWLPDAPWRPLVSSLGYTAGFVIVVLGRQQLFTETTLNVILPLLHSACRLSDVARFWAIVLAANLLGTLPFAIAASTGVFPPEVRASFLELGLEAAQGGFLVLFARAIFAGWLIALMVWLLPAAGSARFLVIVTLAWIVGAAGFAHVIAGSVEVIFAVIAGPLSWGDYLAGYLLPVLAGNIVGGVVLVSMLNHAQVKAEL